MNLLTKLKKLGFTENEAKVYLVLLKTGFSTAGPIIKATDLHRNIVYDCLDKLVKRKLASESLLRGKKHFRPLNPEKIVRVKQQNLALAEQVVPALQKLKKSEAQEVTIYEGSEGFQNVHIYQLEHSKAGETFYVIMAGGSEWYKNMGKGFKKFEKARLAKNISIKLTALESRRGEMQSEQGQRKFFSVRYLPAMFKNPTDITVWGDSASIFIFGEPVLSIVITNRKVAQAFKKHFEDLWKIAKP
ncbi:MAG: helix-turn-helix domain-containing protein [Candidatus Doudnabacteria bacterium]